MNPNLDLDMDVKRMDIAVFNSDIGVIEVRFGASQA